jgi:hypothetical protein
MRVEPRSAAKTGMTQPLDLERSQWPRSAIPWEGTDMPDVSAWFGEDSCGTGVKQSAPSPSETGWPVTVQIARIAPNRRRFR